MVRRSRVFRWPASTLPCRRPSPWGNWLALTAIALAWPGAGQAQHLVNALEIPGEAIDAHAGQGVNQNRLGAFGSDLAFVPDTSEPGGGRWYGLVDRGPGGGVMPYEARVQEFRLDVDPQSGRISNFALRRTIVLTQEGGQPLDGQNPQRLGSADQQRHAFDAEGLAYAGAGAWFVSDEYGPLVRRFAAPDDLPSGMGSTVVHWRSERTFDPPANLVPRDATGRINYVAEKDGEPRLATGRAANRGFEGLALSPDGQRLYAALQSPLVNEGPQGDGERGRYVRIVEFDVASGVPHRQFLYELESVADINHRIADEQGHFKRSKQGRSVGISALVAAGPDRFLVLERDNRGVGIDNPQNADHVLRHVGSKRLYEIDLASATDVSQLSLHGVETLDAGVRPVSKRLFLDLQAEIADQGLPLPEKIEGVAIGPRLNDGGHVLVVATDNDFSVTQTKAAIQFDVYTDGTQGPVDGDSKGRKLLHSWLYAFKLHLPGPH